MAGVELGDFNSPDETRTPDKTTVEIVRMGAVAAPGCGWSRDAMVRVHQTDRGGGERCQAHHVGFLQAGAMHVVHDDGTEEEIRAGQAYVIEPGHDAWVVGDDAVVGFEFDSRTAEEYAKG
jgi:hypothetical protein